MRWDLSGFATVPSGTAALRRAGETLPLPKSPALQSPCRPPWASLAPNPQRAPRQNDPGTRKARSKESRSSGEHRSPSRTAVCALRARDRAPQRTEQVGGDTRLPPPVSFGVEGMGWIFFGLKRWGFGEGMLRAGEPGDHH